MLSFLTFLGTACDCLLRSLVGMSTLDPRNICSRTVSFARLHEYMNPGQKYKILAVLSALQGLTAQDGLGSKVFSRFMAQYFTIYCAFCLLCPLEPRSVCSRIVSFASLHECINFGQR